MLNHKTLRNCFLTTCFILILSFAFSAGNFPQPSICDRTCWSARAPQDTIDQESALDRAVIHHTAIAADYNTVSLEESKAKIRSIQNYHMDSLGWADIGYHFLTDKLGNNFEGREGAMTSIPRGAHDGINDNSFGFNVMGYFHDPYNQLPTCQQRSSCYDLIAWRMPDPFDGYGESWYGRRNRIVGYLCAHRDVGSTACPGDLMYQYVGTDIYAGEARDEVNARITSGAGTDLCSSSIWYEDFDGDSLDTSAPEPDWTSISENGMSVTVSNGALHLDGVSGNSYGGVANSEYENHADFSMHTCLTFNNTDSTAGGTAEANAEVRFRCGSGTGYSLSFKAGDNDQVINLRRSDTWEIIQNLEISHAINNADTFYVSIDCQYTQISIKIGTSAGANDIADWNITDGNFLTGCFWLYNWQVMDLEYDYCYVGPSGWDPFGDPTPTPTATPTPTDTPTPTPTPTETPTPTPTETSTGSAYVYDITMSLGSAGSNTYGIATVWIKDDSGNDVSGATVSGDWSGLTSETVSGITGSDGKVTLESSKTKSSGTFTFCVMGVTATGLTYDDTLNNETCDSISN